MSAMDGLLSRVAMVPFRARAEAGLWLSYYRVQF